MHAWLFHRGALGDSILLWPILRSLVAAHGRVSFVTDCSKAHLAARLMPQSSAWPWFVARTRDTQAMIEGRRLGRRLREQTRRSAVGLPVVEHPADRMRREGR